MLLNENNFLFKLHIGILRTLSTTNACLKWIFRVGLKVQRFFNTIRQKSEEIISTLAIGL